MGPFFIYRELQKPTEPQIKMWGGFETFQGIHLLSKYKDTL